MIRILPSFFNGTIKAPASEAHAQRLLLAASMTASPTAIHNVPDCSNIDTTLDCLASFGCRFRKESKGELLLEPYVKTSPVPEAVFHFGESAPSARFIIPMAAASGMKADCVGAEALVKRRQLVPLTSRLAVRNVSFTNFSLPFVMQGRLTGGKFLFSGDEDPQFISALLMALPLLRDDSTIVLEKPLPDPSPVDMTIAELERFGITIDRLSDGYHISSGQSYRDHDQLWVDNDWALACAWVIAGAFSAGQGGRITMEGLNPQSHQQYKDLSMVLPLLSYDFKELNLDCTAFPNLATIIAYAALLKGTKFILSGFLQLRYEDTDRIKALELATQQFGGRFHIEGDVVTIEGDPDFNYENMVIDCGGDPWMFLSVALCAPLLRYPVFISDEHGADRIYRSFLDDFRFLGGKCEITE